MQIELNKVYCSDFHKFHKYIPDNFVDLVITDPPYTKKFLYTYSYLSDFCPRIMKRGASLLCIVGHYALPFVVKVFDGKLKYRWIFSMDQSNGPHARMAMGIEVMWKPVLWYVKDAYPSGRGFIRDCVKITGEDGQKKPRHKWEQDISWCSYFIQKLTDKDSIVLDPFCGSGATLHACKLLGVPYIGVDIDPEAVEITNKRLKEI